MKQLHPIAANPANAVLVVVDVQNAFTKEGGSNAAGGRVTAAQAQAAAAPIASIRGLVGKARQALVPVIYIQSVRTYSEPLITVFNFPKILARGSWDAQIVDGLSPQDGDFVVEKFCLDPFYKTDLDGVLNRLVSDPVRHQAIVTGGAITVCAYNAIMGFHLRDFWTIVATDAVYGSQSGMALAMEQFSSPLYPNIFLTRCDLVDFSATPKVGVTNLIPNT